MKLIISLITCFMVQTSFGFIEEEIVTSFYHTISEKDPSITEDQSVIKFNLNRLNTRVFIKKKGNGKKWGDWEIYQENTDEMMLVDTLPAGEYEFRFEKFHFETVYGSIKLKSQYFNEVAVSLLEQRSIQKVLEKPAVYIYSVEPMDVHLTIEPVGKFGFTYPEHGDDGWRVHVDQNGMTCDGKSYDYLFWDAIQDHLDFNYNRGFVFKGEESIAFMEEKLTQLGLNDREMQDFISYWGPRLTSNSYNYVHFITDEDYNQSIGGLKSSKEFDSSLRIFMGFKALDSPIPVIEQDLKSFTRIGLTLVEWGGGDVSLKQLGL